MRLERAQPCGCGHDWMLHDAFGCAAFLGAFLETADVAGYCACRTARSESLRAPCLDGANAAPPNAAPRPVKLAG